ncbi:putative sarcosine oxidase [Dinoroseobacter shibae DFL 12 = DSM 16493]|uniref:Putative sarcosine oxidase n=1 Tax=Dinoroseobacter shibae (strain DSM 16493 / NCIMB 14021 / DFL 12) TaxID=398580 RepID=A8LR76_DINSH|nr:putative sarcosine oxidase [Dinoroseobacter shibae]ABV93999.1 putative sarcosine oxidase [Dinoroseobacter shibae DFL 12 = DSM 16493]URF45443.1 sarcosine oxidase subunit gamma [Dinoroseobacter shibae]URF49748.1 sarcosine oxidase subunit gamma [Dinoroseobacter shibae]
MADPASLAPACPLPAVKIGTVALTEVAVGTVMSVQPYPGAGQAVSTKLAQLTGIPFPEPGRSADFEDLRVLWAGRDTAFLVGEVPPLDLLCGEAALTDQSDAWVVLRLSGSQAREVLARLTPLDLRDTAFTEGQTARTELAHMAVLLVALPAAVEIWLMRSMRLTALDKLSQAMKSVAARAARDRDTGDAAP